MNRDDEIRARHQAAEKGPWKTDDFGMYIFLENDLMLAQIRGWGRMIGNPGFMKEEDAEAQQKANAQFIAHSWDDVRYLLGEKARLLHELDEMRRRAEAAEAKIEQVREAAKERGRALAQKGIRQ
jgi:hypothetical protein